MGFFSTLLGNNQAESGLADASAAIGAGYDKAIAGYQPYVSAGQNALTTYLNATGQGDSAAGLAAFKSSPIYNLLSQSLNLGDTGVLSRAAGSLNSGNTIRAVNDYNANAANGAFGNWLSGVSGTANQGYSAMSNVGNLGIGKADTQGKIRAQIGQVQQENSIGAGLDNLASNIAQGAGFLTGMGGGGGMSGFGGGSLLGGGSGNFLTRFGQTAAERLGTATSLY